MTTTEQILDDAGQIIADGWMQGDYCNGEYSGTFDHQLATATHYCALGAVREAYRRRQCGITADMNPASEVLGQVLRQAGIRSSIHSWNDGQGRTQVEVVELFEKARALAAEKGI